MTETERYVWEVDSTDDAAGRVCVSLVRRLERESSKHLLHRNETLERTVIHARSFRPMLDAVAMEHYTARLQLVARYAQAGEFGCFAQTRSEGTSVEVVLYERSFDGTEIRTEELARRAFDAGDDDALVASTEFLADLRIWADARNEERDAAAREQRDADAVRAELASEQEAAARELAEILASHARPDSVSER